MAKFYHYTTWHGLKHMCAGEWNRSRYVYSDCNLQGILKLPPHSKEHERIKRELTNNGEAMVDSRNTRGLWPMNQFRKWKRPGQIKHPDMNRKVIEGVLEPLPENWNTNPIIPHTLDNLLDVIYGEQGYDKVILLEIETKPSDRAYVTDWATARNHDGEDQSRAAADQRYLEQRVPIDQYTGKEGFHCPIVVCYNPIPPDQIKVVAEMPIKPYSPPEQIRAQLQAYLEQELRLGHKDKLLKNRTYRLSSASEEGASR